MNSLYLVLAISFACASGFSVISDYSEDMESAEYDGPIILIKLPTGPETVHDSEPEPTTTTTTTPIDQPKNTGCENCDCDCGEAVMSETAACEDGWVTFGHKCLKLRYTPVTYIQAFNICRDEHNAKIFRIESAEEQIFFEKLFVETGIGKMKGGGSKFMYLGMERCPHTGFNWVGQDGEKTPIKYENWDIGEPHSMRGIGTEACGVVLLGDRHDYGKWHDYGCDRQHVFVCEKLAEDHVLVKYQI